MELIDIAEVCKRTGYHAVTIRNKIRAGVLPAERRGRKLFVRADDLAKLYNRA